MFAFLQASSHLKKVLFGLTALGILLLMFHLAWTRTIYYVFLPWNLFLGTMPFLMASLFAKNFSEKNLIVASAWLFLWLLFFPNAPYIITDYIHVFDPELFYTLTGRVSPYPPETFIRPALQMTYEFVLVSIFVVTALIMAYESIRIIIKKLKLKPWYVTLPLGALSGIGIYIGRVIRFNSWDVFMRPYTVVREVFLRLWHGEIADPVFLICFFASIAVVWGGFELYRRFND